MKPEFRLTRSTDFERVRRFGQSYPHPLVVLIALSNEAGQTRVGVAAGRAIGGAVQRNRAKRLLRAAVDPLTSLIAPGHDLVLLARRPILRAKSPQVRVALQALLKRARLLEET